MKEGKSPFKGLKDEIVELNIGGQKILAKPTVKDVEVFLTLKKEIDGDDASRISKMLVDMVARANPDEDREDIEAFISRHYGDVLMQSSMVFGFSTPDQLEATKKKLSEVK